jgi:hypothetical protein
VLRLGIPRQLSLTRVVVPPRISISPVMISPRFLGTRHDLVIVVNTLLIQPRPHANDSSPYLAPFVGFLTADLIWTLPMELRTRPQHIRRRAKRMLQNLVLLPHGPLDKMLPKQWISPELIRAATVAMCGWAPLQNPGICMMAIPPPPLRSLDLIRRTIARMNVVPNIVASSSRLPTSPCAGRVEVG